LIQEVQPVLTFSLERSQSSIQIKVLLPSVNIKFDVSMQFHPSPHIPSSGTSGTIIWYMTHFMFVNKSAAGHFHYHKWHEEKRHWQFFKIWFELDTSFILSVVICQTNTIGAICHVLLFPRG